MDVAKLTVTRDMNFFNIKKGVTKNPAAQQVHKALQGQSIRQLIERFEAPKLWDGSRDITDLSYKGKGIEKIHMMPQKTDTPVEWGYTPSFISSERIRRGLSKLLEESKKLGIKFEPVTEDMSIKNSHTFVGEYDRLRNLEPVSPEGYGLLTGERPRRLILEDVGGIPTAEQRAATAKLIEDFKKIPQKLQNDN